MVSGKSFSRCLSVSFLDSLCRHFLMSSVYQSHNSLCVCLISCASALHVLASFILITSLKCLAHSGCPRLICLVSEWKLKIMNEKHPDSCIWWGTNKGSIAEWRWKFARAPDSHSGGREGLLCERVSASTTPTTSSDAEILARKYMTSPQKLQRTGQLLSEGITQNPINYASCPQVTPGSHLPDSLL